MREMAVGNIAITLVDDDVYDVLSVHTWGLDRDGYVFGKIDGKNVRLHRVVMDAPKGLQVDHINHDLLDNRRENLRLCTQSQNNMNRRKLEGRTSKYRGVYKDFRNYKGTVYEYWGVQIKIGGKVMYRGRFKNEEEAARAYDVNAIKYYGEFAVLNFPDES